MTRIIRFPPLVTKECKTRERKCRGRGGERIGGFWSLSPFHPFQNRTHYCQGWGCTLYGYNSQSNNFFCSIQSSTFSSGASQHSLAFSSVAFPSQRRFWCGRVRVLTSIAFCWWSLHRCRNSRDREVLLTVHSTVLQNLACLSNPEKRIHKHWHRERIPSCWK